MGSPRLLPTIQSKPSHMPTQVHTQVLVVFCWAKELWGVMLTVM